MAQARPNLDDMPRRRNKLFTLLAARHESPLEAFNTIDPQEHLLPLLGVQHLQRAAGSRGQRGGDEYFAIENNNKK